MWRNVFLKETICKTCPIEDDDFDADFNDDQYEENDSFSQDENKTYETDDEWYQEPEGETIELKTEKDSTLVK